MVAKDPGGAKSLEVHPIIIPIVGSICPPFAANALRPGDGEDFAVLAEQTRRAEISFLIQIDRQRGRSFQQPRRALNEDLV